MIKALSKDQIIDLLAIQKKQDVAINKIAEVGIELPNEIEVDLLGFVADMCGVPKDNSGGGKMLQGEKTYCRDWVYIAWEEVVADRMSIEELIGVFESEAIGGIQ